mgnify:CR=1 FL=1
MSLLAWPSDYLSANGNGLNIPSLLDDFKASSGLLDLSADENSIFRSTLEALIWSYPINQTYRLYNLNTRTQAPANSLFKPGFAASWLNESSSPAPNASVLYMPAWLDLRKVDEADHGEQVLQLPKNPDDAYYILAVLDAYINTVGSLGPRTIPKGGSEFPQQILLVGPDSTYYGKGIQEVTIQGAKLPVLQVDTSMAWITARIDTNTLDADAMTATRAFINGTKDDLGSGFQVTSLKDFKETGDVPWVVGLSGGKDSTYQTYLIKESGLKPLLSNFEPSFMAFLIPRGMEIKYTSNVVHRPRDIDTGILSNTNEVTF